MILSPYRFAAAGGTDPYWSNVVSLLHFDGTNGSTTITDVKGLAWAVSGTANLSTGDAKFGTAGLVAATAGVLSPVNAGFTMGTGDFTVEGFYRPQNLTGGLMVADSRASGASNGWAFYTSGAQIRFYAATGDRALGPSLTNGTYYHVAYSRNSGVGRFYVDGVQYGSNYTDSNNYADTRMSIGYQYGIGGGASAGFFDEWRITKGVARYTANFTAPTSAFPNS